MMITEAQMATLRRIRANNLSGDYEIAATRLNGDVLHVYFSRRRVSILPDGTFGSGEYGTRRIGRFGTVTVTRPVDLLLEVGLRRLRNHHPQRPTR